MYDDPDNVYHSHRIMKHEATGRWGDVYGDGGERNKVVKSDDDGQTWSTLDPQMDNHFQPVEFHDFGHPTDLLYGSDAMSFIGRFNVLTRKITPVYDDGDRYIPFVFSLFYHDGVFYAGTFSNVDLSTRRTAILVSSDLVHWAVYHQFRNSEKAVHRFLGFAGDKIHGIVALADTSVTSVWRRFSFTPTTVKLVNGLCLDPATTNMIDNVQDSSVEGGDPNWTASGGTVERVSTDSVHGTECLRVYGNSGVDYIDTNYRTVEAGQTYNGRIWLKANGQNVTGRVTWISGDYSAGPAHLFALSQDRWTEIVLNPITIPSGVRKLRIRIKPRSTGFPGPYDMLIDGVQIEQGPPTRWQVGGIGRDGETLSKTVVVPEGWTNLVLWAPESRSEWYQNSGNQYIKTWCKDFDNYVELYFDPSDNTFALQATVDGVAQTPMKTSSYTFYRNGAVRFAIRCNEDAVVLSVSAAAPYEHVSGPTIDFLRSSVLTSKTGDHDGARVMSSTLLADELYGCVLGDDQLE